MESYFFHVIFVACSVLLALTGLDFAVNGFRFDNSPFLLFLMFTVLSGTLYLMGW